MPKRVIETCSPDTECSDDEIDSLIEEYYLVQDDYDIAHFEHPSIEEMKEIIQRAEKYSGEWYHSEVTLPSEPSYTDTEEYLNLWNQIDELGKDAGIYLFYEFETNSH